MTSPAKFRKDKEIVAEYETQVKGKTSCLKKKLSVNVYITGMCCEICSGCLHGEPSLNWLDCMGFPLPSPLLSGVKGARCLFVFRRSFAEVNWHDGAETDR